jgi:hypothetical protein
MMMVEILLIVVDILNVAEVLLISLFKSQSNVRILHCGWFIVSSSIVALYPLLSLEEM